MDRTHYIVAQSKPKMKRKTVIDSDSSVSNSDPEKENDTTDSASETKIETSSVKMVNIVRLICYIYQQTHLLFHMCS